MFADIRQSCQTEVISQESDALEEKVATLGWYHKYACVEIGKNNAKHLHLAFLQLNEEFPLLLVVSIEEMTEELAEDAHQPITTGKTMLSVENYLPVHLPVFLHHPHVFTVFV